jgi:hypothetical protein
MATGPKARIRGILALLSRHDPACNDCAKTIEGESRLLQRDRNLQLLASHFSIQGRREKYPI